MDVPLEFIDINVRGSQILINASSNVDSLEQIIFISSRSAVGEVPDANSSMREENAFRPINPYGASKAAGEGLISAYCEGFGFQACIFRFVSILGERYTHGHVFDFYQKLKADPGLLQVLGNGKQRKSYFK